MNTHLEDFATRYTAAWCSRNPNAVAAFYSPDGSLTINNGKPSKGRAAITEAARAFMTAFPNLIVTFDRLAIEGARAQYHWTLTGTYAPNSRPVRISGLEQWTFDADGLILDSQGHFDEADYRRQTS